jgi:hypothetical protein
VFCVLAVPIGISSISCFDEIFFNSLDSIWELLQ